MTPIQDEIRGSMTVEQFAAAVAAFPRLSDTGKAAARSVLVDGFGQAAVAARLNKTRQQVNKWVQDIHQMHLNCPDGWRVGVVTLPPDLMNKVVAMERKAKASTRKKGKG